MKPLLIVIFIILFIYLLIHMCGGLADRGTPVRSDKEIDKNLLVLDGLMSLEDKDLCRLKNELDDLKSLLDGERANNTSQTRATGQERPEWIENRNALSGKQTLEMINREMKKYENKKFRNRGSSFSKIRIILVQIALILITLFMVLF